MTTPFRVGSRALLTHNVVRPDEKPKNFAEVGADLIL